MQNNYTQMQKNHKQMQNNYKGMLNAQTTCECVKGTIFP